NRVAEDVRKRVDFGNMTCGLADHQSQLSFVIGAMLRIRDANRLPGSNERRGGLHEEDGLFLNLTIRIALGDVGEIVESDADDFPWLNRGQGCDVIERSDSCTGLQTNRQEWIAYSIKYSRPFDDSPAGEWFAAQGKPHDSHFLAFLSDP